MRSYVMSRHMRKPTICIGENKGTDQLCSNCKVDQHLSFFLFLYFLNTKFPASNHLVLTVQPGLCWTWLEPKLLVNCKVFSRTGSNGNLMTGQHQKIVSRIKMVERKYSHLNREPSKTPLTLILICKFAFKVRKLDRDIFV